MVERLPAPAEVLRVLTRLKITTLGLGLVLVDGTACKRDPKDISEWILSEEPDESGEPSGLWRHPAGGLHPLGDHLRTIATHYLTPSRPRQEVQSDG